MFHPAPEDGNLNGKFVPQSGATARADGPGFARALSPVVTDLRLAKLKPTTVRTVAPDLMPLFEAYESNLAESGFTDWAGVLTTATDALMSFSSSGASAVAATAAAAAPSYCVSRRAFSSRIRMALPQSSARVDASGPLAC